MYKRTVNYKERQARLATEWDVRLDISEELTVEHILGRVREQLDELSYVLVSGVERPDIKEIKGVPANQHGSDENHVHMCVVLFVPKQRADVLKMVRGPRKLGDEYCTPRNAKFPYAGWIIHHGKPGFKIDNEPLIRFEQGTLPMDPFTTDWAMKIAALLKKWGTPGMHARFKGYTDLLNKNKLKERIEALQMALEDNDTN